VITRRPPDISYRVHALRCLDQLPPLSLVLNKLIASLAREDVSYALLSALIEQDAVLSANLLRLVNSAAYGRRGTVSSVRHAVSLIGLHKLRNAAMSISVSRLWAKVQTPEGWSAVRFNQHCTATAVLADLLAQEVPVEYPEGAFAAGLLHDLGRLLIAIALPEEHREIGVMMKANSGAACDCESALIQVTHAELSFAALEKWNLPSAIAHAARRHHAPQRAGPSDILSLCTVVNVADTCAHQLGIAIEPCEPNVEQALATLAAFGLPADRSASTLESFRIDFEPLRSAV
jgi:putative nucleotidyltransferase with HDIG domain